MRVFISLSIILSLSVLSLAFSAERSNSKYVEVHDMVTPVGQLPPQDPAIHSFPTVPTVPLVPTCVQEGYFRDPFNCRKFYRCTDVDAVPAGFYCQPSLIFNPDTNTCDNSDYVQC